MKCQLVKDTGGYLRPAFQADIDALQKIKIGTLINADVKQQRNPAFHRKFMKLLTVAFEYFEPEIKIDKHSSVILKNYKVEKDFTRFRKDVMILAGFRHPVVNIKGEVRWEADSVSFANMDDTRFQEVYTQVFNVIWRLVMSKVQGMSEDDVHNAVNKMMSYE